MLYLLIANRMSHQVRSDPTEAGRQSRSHGPEPRASTAVVQAVAAAAETSPEELPPLTDVVDPDALDVLFSSTGTSGSIRFRYAGYHVTVFSDGTVTVAAGGD